MQIFVLFAFCSYLELVYYFLLNLSVQRYADPDECRMEWAEVILLQEALSWKTVQLENKDSVT